MFVRQLFVAVVVAGSCSLAFPSTALADDNTVTYEVISDAITNANVEYFDGTASQQVDNVTVPWKTDATVGDLGNGAKQANHAEMKVSWTPIPGEVVTTRITYKDKVICQNTVDTGQASCDFTNFFGQRQAGLGT